MALPLLFARRGTSTPEDNLRAISRIVPQWKAAQPIPPTRDLRRYAEEGYKKNILIMRCVNIRARAMGQPPLLARRAATDEVLPDEHPMARLLSRPNPEQSRYEFLRNMQTYRAIAGIAYIEKVRSSKLGEPVQLWNLRPDRMKIKVDSSGRVKHYLFTPEGEDKGRQIPPEDVIAIPWGLDPTDDFYGLSPLAVLASVGDLDNNAVDFLRAYFTNGGAPKGVLKLKTKVKKPVRDDLKDQWRAEHTGPEGFHGLAVLDTDAEYQKIGSNPSELAIDNVFDEAATRICAAWDIPPIMAGTRIGLASSTYANVAEARKQLWQDVLVPDFIAIGDRLTLGLALDFEEGLEAFFDTTKVEALQENAAEREERALKAFEGGVLKLNEARERFGVEPEAEGDVYHIGGRLVPPADLIQEQRPPQLPAGPVIDVKPALPGQKEDEDEGNEEQQRSTRRDGAEGFADFARGGEGAGLVSAGHHGAGEGAGPRLTNEQWARQAALAPLQIADEYAPALAAPLESAVAYTRGRLPHSRVLTLLSEDADPDTVLDVIPWGFLAVSDAYAANGEAVFKRAYEFTVRSTLARLRGNKAAHMATVNETFVRRLTTPEEGITAGIIRRLATRIVGLDAAEKERIREVIVQGRDRGHKPQTIRRRIARVIGLTPRQERGLELYRESLEKKGGLRTASITKLVRAREKAAIQARSKLIAENESLRLAGLAQNQAWKKLAKVGVLPEKARVQWLTMGDDVVSNICRPLDGRIRPVGADFGDGDGYYVPGDTHPRCRCSRIMVFHGEDEL